MTPGVSSFQSGLRQRTCSRWPSLTPVRVCSKSAAAPSSITVRGFQGQVNNSLISTSDPHFKLLVLVEFGFAFFYGGGVSEDPEWRGFLLPRLQQRMSPLFASLLIWLPWTLWHAPLDFAGYGGATLPDYLRNRVIILVATCIIMTWLYNRSGGAIPTAALFHSAFNIAPDFISSARWSFLLIVVVALGVVVMDKMWKRKAPKESE